MSLTSNLHWQAASLPLEPVGKAKGKSEILNAFLFRRGFERQVFSKAGSPESTRFGQAGPLSPAKDTGKLTP